MKRKIAALAVSLLASIGMVAVAAPVSAAVPQVCNTIVNNANKVESQTCVPVAKIKSSESARWSYCYPTVQELYITFFDNQGF